MGGGGRGLGGPPGFATARERLKITSESMGVAIDFELQSSLEAEL
jgi:hypothetical protein